MTDICDKFSNSSSIFLSINARLGAGISKDSLKRFIVSRCKELEHKQRFISSSFDNLDKNQSYSLVGADRDKSGFHGTTIQTAKPCPSLNNMNNTPFSNFILDSRFPEIVISSTDSSFCNPDAELNISSTESSFTSLLSELTTTRDRTIPTDFVMPIIDPENRVGLPLPDSHNRFSNVCLADFDINSSELESWETFSKGMFK